MWSRPLFMYKWLVLNWAGFQIGLRRRPSQISKKTLTDVLAIWWLPGKSWTMFFFSFLAASPQRRYKEEEDEEEKVKAYLSPSLKNQIRPLPFLIFFPARHTLFHIACLPTGRREGKFLFFVQNIFFFLLYIINRLRSK